MVETSIQFTDLHKSYGETAALKGIDLMARPGELVGMIGPDGAGKTTAMRIACGLLLPDKGTTEVFGYDSARETRKVKEHLGYMPQRFSLYPDLSVSENLRFFADLYRVSSSERRVREERLMQFSRLGDFRQRRAGRLSGGMKQKLALSCTLIHTPNVLILDEPTTGVDPVSRKEFWAILKELAEDGLALLISTPYMDEAELCDRVYLMHEGRVIASGKPEEVAALFPKKLLEVVGEKTAEARNALREVPGLDVHRFGDRLHVIYETKEQEQQVHDQLQHLEVQVTQAAPTIEDTFVALMQVEQEVVL